MEPRVTATPTYWCSPGSAAVSHGAGTARLASRKASDRMCRQCGLEVKEALMWEFGGLRSPAKDGDPASRVEHPGRVADVHLTRMMPCC